jgi:hypothetical protein
MSITESLSNISTRSSQSHNKNACAHLVVDWKKRSGTRWHRLLTISCIPKLRTSPRSSKLKPQPPNTTPILHEPNAWPLCTPFQPSLLQLFDSFISKESTTARRIQNNFSKTEIRTTLLKHYTWSNTSYSMREPKSEMHRRGSNVSKSVFNASNGQRRLNAKENQENNTQTWITRSSRRSARAKPVVIDCAGCIDSSLIDRCLHESNQGQGETETPQAGCCSRGGEDRKQSIMLLCECLSKNSHRVCGS